MSNPQQIIRLPLIDDLDDEDIKAFKAFLAQKFPPPLNTMVNIFVVKQGTKRGILAGWSMLND